MFPSAAERDRVRGVLKTWRMVAVDDELESARLLQRCLGAFGAEVYTALDGEAGLWLVRVIKPHMILVDLSMPVMDGWELLKQIRKDANLRDLPVVVLTAHAMVDVQDRVQAAGFDGYITKPYLPSALATELVSIEAKLALKRRNGTGTLPSVGAGLLSALRTSG